MVPTRRLALLALLVGVALFAYPGDTFGGVWGSLALLDGLLLAVAFVDARLAPRPGTIVVRRRHPPVVIVGATAELTWTVTSTASRASRIHIADALPPSLGAVTRRATLRLAARGDATITTTFRPTRRGRFQLSDVVVRAEGPLGIGARQHRTHVSTLLRVHPPFRSREEAELLIRRARILEVGLRSARGLGSGTEFEQLREYTTDDEFRRVDWAASARAGKPIVRTYRPELNQTVVLLLDSGRLMAAQVAGVPRIEHAMDAATMLTHVATRLGDRVGIVAFDAQPRAIVAPSRHHDQTARLTEAMYALEPTLVESDYRGAFSTMLARFRRRSLIVILSDLAGPTMSESLGPALPLVLRHHLVVVAAVRDPEVVAWSTTAPADSSEAYRQAAAVAALAERDKAVARLRGLGVTVVDAEPGRLGGELANVYLHIKSTGRL